MTERTRFGSGYPMEEEVGYSRAVRVGNRIYVAGTVASDETGAGDGAGRRLRAGEIYSGEDRAGARRAGGAMENVVRTRMFVTDMSLQGEFGRAHGEFFREIRPAATMVGVAALVDPGFLIEIEVEAEL